MIVFGTLSLEDWARGGVVRRSRFSVEQIVSVLKQVELDMSVADAIRKIEISGQTFLSMEEAVRQPGPYVARHQASEMVTSLRMAT